MKQVIVVTKLRRSDLRSVTQRDHFATLNGVKKFLSGEKIGFQVLDRSRLREKLRGDLVVAVGGDGTVLAAAHFTDQVPLLGINSAPKTSTGFFCLANPQNFALIIQGILKGKRCPKSVPRLEVIVNGKKFPATGLNDFLFASRLQGDTARYRLRIGKREEEQKSSGIWVATGAGSTAAILSAGGKKDSPFSERLQFQVREPCSFPRNKCQLLHGFLKSGQSLTLISQMNDGMIFVDGAKLHSRVPKNARITVRGGRKPLKIFI